MANEDGELRKSRRLRSTDPEYLPFRDPEKTLRDNSPFLARKKSDSSSSESPDSENYWNEDPLGNLSKRRELLKKDLKNLTSNKVPEGGLNLNSWPTQWDADENDEARRSSNQILNCNSTQVKKQVDNEAESSTSGPEDLQIGCITQAPNLDQSSIVRRAPKQCSYSDSIKEKVVIKQYSINSTQTPIPKSPPSNRGQPQPAAEQNGIYIWTFCFTLLLLMGFWSYCEYLKSEKKFDPKKEFPLVKEFPNQNESLWGYVSYGRQTMEPFCLLLVHADQDALSSCLAERIAGDVVSKRIGEISVNPKIIDAKNLDNNILEMLRPEIEDKKGLVILHVEELAAHAAHDFHYILDVHEPWVSGGVYVLTLNVPNIGKSSKKTFEDIRDFLISKWSGLFKEEELEALITRFSNFEYVVVEEVRNPCL